MEIELEKTYLLKYVPEDLNDHKYVEVLDSYIPQSYPHPILRIRKVGDVKEITKKHPVDKNDASRQEEHTISLSEEEFQSLVKVEGKKVEKNRYFYPIKNNTAEISIFQNDLKGLAMVDVEFKSIEEKESFKMPDFCLIEITQDGTFGGGSLAGKKYSDIEPALEKYSYKKII